MDGERERCAAAGVFKDNNYQVNDISAQEEVWDILLGLINTEFMVTKLQGYLQVNIAPELEELY